MTEQNNGVRIASKSDLEEGRPFCVTANGTALAVFQIDGKLYAVANTCPHAGGPLCEGTVKAGAVTCPWHGSRFKIDTGEAIHGPAKTGVASYPVEIRGDDVFVILQKMSDDGEPKAVTFSFEPKFDRERPFANEAFLHELLQEMKFPFKLYGVLPFVIIAQSADEIDAHLGEVHITEMDLQKLSSVMKALNEKWKVSITYCIFHSAQFPGAMLMNIRGPHAPMSLENAIKYR